MRKLRFWVIGLLGFAGHAAAAQLISLADIDLSTDNLTRVYLSEVTENGGAVVIGAPVEASGVMSTDAQVWGIGSSEQGRRVVYGAFSGDAAFDDLFVVDLRFPGIATQLNPPRNVGVDSPFSFAVETRGSKVAYTIRDINTTTDQLFVADVRLPGTGTAISSPFPSGTTIASIAISPGGGAAVYEVTAAGGGQQLWLSFLALPANATKIDPTPTSNEYRPREVIFTDDGARVLWRSRGASSEPEPLYLVEIDTVARTVSDPVVVNGEILTNERVFEFELKPGTVDQLAYRAFSAGSSSPGDVFLVDLDSPGDATMLNPTFTPGAGFTRWEDLEWFGDAVVYNASQEDANLAEVFQVVASNPGVATKISTSVPLNTVSGSSSVAGASHFIKSPAGNKLVVIDGDPADGIYVIDPAAPSTVFSPFGIGTTQSVGAPDNPNDPQDDGSAKPSFDSTSSLLALRVDDLDESNAVESRNLQVAVVTQDASNQDVFSDGGGVDVRDFYWVADGSFSSADPTALAAAVLPASRSGQVGSTLTAFVTLINGGNAAAEQCSIGLLSNLQATLLYQTTDPATNAPTGTPNSPTDIGVGQSQSFVISLQLNGTFAPAEALLGFGCLNSDTVQPLPGLNTLLVSSSATPVPDVIALAATVSNDGIANLDNDGNGAFSVASVNVGQTATINVSAEATNSSLPLTVAMCESHPVSGACVNPTAPTFDPVVVNVPNNATPTFSVFVSTSSNIPLDAANNRVRVVFQEDDGTVRGQTSVAVAGG